MQFPGFRFEDVRSEGLLMYLGIIWVEILGKDHFEEIVNFFSNYVINP